MEKLLLNWNIARVLRLVLAGVFLAAGISRGDTIAYVAAAVFGLQAIFNVGCIGASCAPASKMVHGEIDVKDNSYEEVK